jgi:hypothetical protein
VRRLFVVHHVAHALENPEMPRSLLDCYPPQRRYSPHVHANQEEVSGGHVVDIRWLRSKIQVATICDSRAGDRQGSCYWPQLEIVAFASTRALREKVPSLATAEKLEKAYPSFHSHPN